MVHWCTVLNLLMGETLPGHGSPVMLRQAFMSTTLDRDVAMGYAGTGGSAAGIVFEIVQGMVDRGADIGWLSARPRQPSLFPHYAFVLLFV